MSMMGLPAIIQAIPVVGPKKALISPSAQSQ